MRKCNTSDVQASSTSPANYGTRLDYILVTPGLLPWIHFSDIQAHVHGSDHCPVYVDFHDEIEIEGRGRVRLWDEMNPGRDPNDPPPTPPSFAARNLKEFSSAQKLLASFFGKSATNSPSPALEGNPSKPVPASNSTARTTSSALKSSTPKSPAQVKKEEHESSQPRPSLTKSRSSESSETRWKGKAKDPPPERNEAAQKSISSFFQKPAVAVKEEKTKVKKKTKRAASQSAPALVTSPQRRPSNGPGDEADVIVIEDDDADVLNGARVETPDLGNGNGAVAKVLAAAEAQNELADFNEDDFEASASTNNEVASAWSSIFAAKSAPVCDGHGEPTKLWTVNKTGINKGRRFYLCQR